MCEPSQHVAELRDKFLKKLEDDESQNFHPADIDRIKSTDKWLQRFLEHNEFNVQEALKMLWDTCEWRKNFGTNDITEQNVSKKDLESGVCFPYGEDSDGKRLFIIRSKLHTKNSSEFLELQRCIVYWFERLERERNGDQITLFFDMIDAGISNLDMSLTRFLIGLFKNYYPNFLNYIIILEMPWTFNAAFNIIKSWLPAKAIPKIKFIKKATMTNFVESKTALKCWGENSDFTFVFVSESQANSLTNGKSDNRKVHFTGNSSSTNQSDTNCTDQMEADAILSVEPDIITFTKCENEMIGIITLTNAMASKKLTYKVKTTAPNKFKVRPSTGILQASEKVSVTITLQNWCNSQSVLEKDKFLIMCLPIEKPNLLNSDLVDFWKANESTAKQYRLICRNGSENSYDGKSNLSMYGTGSNADTSINSLFSRIHQVEKRHINLQKDITIIKYLLLISTTAIFAFLFYFVYTFKTNFQYFHPEQNCHNTVNRDWPKHDEI